MNAFKAKRRMDLMSLAVQRNDLAAVKFLVEQKTHYLRHYKEEDNNKSSDEDRHKFITIGSDILNMCLRDGRTQILGYLMSTTGLGFPFEALMKEAGVKPETEPKVCN